ncbi:MAG: DoxX family protein [Saprospiraceae bacterium]|nr:DoxX family protein [Saprospiraceae bacterium]
MTKLGIHNSIKTIFSLFILISAMGEFTHNETVVSSMVVIQMPEYLLDLLGALKVLGVIAIWFSPYSWIKEWAYAGFVFDLIGAIYAFLILKEFILPDIIMAPAALILCILTYASWRNTTRVGA